MQGYKSEKVAVSANTKILILKLITTQYLEYSPNAMLCPLIQRY